MSQGPRTKEFIRLFPFQLGLVVLSMTATLVHTYLAFRQISGPDDTALLPTGSDYLDNLSLFENLLVAGVGLGIFIATIALSHKVMDDLKKNNYD